MKRALIIYFLSIPCLVGSARADSEIDTTALRLPLGFRIEVLVADVPDARSMALGDQGTLFVGTRRKGNVYAIRNVFGDRPEVLTIATGRQTPNGIAFHDGDLYLAEVGSISRFSDIERRLPYPGDPEIVVDDLPPAKLHSWRYIGFGPDDRLYVAIGAPCNVCDEPDYGVILRMNSDGSEREVFARGVRNSVGFTWHPDSQKFWFTDNGRDMMGDDLPPGELNRAEKPGLHFGFPFCHGGTIPDPDPKLASLGACLDAESPVQPLGPHVAPLGIRFYTGGAFPNEYHNQVLIAEHGSWNRSKKIGYRVSLVRLQDGRPVSYEPFVEGWLDGEKVSGRPVDLLIAPDGAVLLSDDMNGVIYRISYSEVSG